MRPHKSNIFYLMFPRKSPHKHRLSGSLLSHSRKGCSGYRGADLIPSLYCNFFLTNLAFKLFKIISQHLQFTSVSHLNISFAYGKHIGWRMSTNHRSQQHSQLRHNQSCIYSGSLPCSKLDHTRGYQRPKTVHCPVGQEGQVSKDYHLPSKQGT